MTPPTFCEATSKTGVRRSQSTGPPFRPWHRFGADLERRTCRTSIVSALMATVAQSRTREHTPWTCS
jgi:hypothetical protein